MTSRPEQPYSLIPLQKIKNGTIDNHITNGLENTVFYDFKSEFIKGDGKIFQKPPGDVPSMYNDPQAIGFLIHYMILNLILWIAKEILDQTILIIAIKNSGFHFY